MDWKLELVAIPVSDVDRAKTFYTEKVGFNLDSDRRLGEEFRIVQMTPKGSACSIAVGTGITDAAPGSVRELHLVVPDIEVARAELAKRGVDVSDARHLGPDGWAPGPDPERRDYNSIADFGDPDGNTWVLQERGRQLPKTNLAAPFRPRCRYFQYLVRFGSPAAPSAIVGPNCHRRSRIESRAQSAVVGCAWHPRSDQDRGAASQTSAST